MKKINEGLNVYYVKDLKTGNILPVNVRGGKAEQEKINKQLKKEGKEHLIRFVVVDKPEEKKEPVKKGRPKQEK